MTIKSTIAVTTAFYLTFFTSVIAAAPASPEYSYRQYHITDTSNDASLWPGSYICELSLDTDEQHTATAAEMSSMYPYALMSYFAEMYKVDSSKPDKKQALQERIEKLDTAGFYAFTRLTKTVELPESWQSDFKARQQNRFVSSRSSLKARVYINEADNTITIAIAGTDFSSLTSLYSAAQLAAGYASAAATEAVNLTKDIQQANPGYTLILTGASQGGAIAQYVVSRTAETRAIVFNSQALHPKLIQQALTEKEVTHLFVEGEAMSPDSDHLVEYLIQNPMPVAGKMIPVDPELDAIIINTYFSYARGNTATGWVSYQTSTLSFIRHWTGALLTAIEQHNGYAMSKLFP